MSVFIVCGWSILQILVVMHNYKITESDIDVYKIVCFGKMSFYNLAMIAFLASSAVAPINPIFQIYVTALSLKLNSFFFLRFMGTWVAQLVRSDHDLRVQGLSFTSGSLLSSVFVSLPLPFCLLVLYLK